MTEIILHHYDLSPYAEKARLALGFKGMAWRSVQVPMVLPKPDHFELTGGYRRVPVLQLGADIYCDTHLITRVLDRMQPSPPLAPPGLETVSHAVSRWAETSFMMLINAFFGIGGVFPEEFIDDRRKTMIPPTMDLDAAPRILGTKLLQIRSNVLRLEGMLEDGRAFLLGEDPCAADLSAYHPVMMFALHEKTRALLEGAPRVQAWAGRVRSIGHGHSTPLSSEKAIGEAHAASPLAYAGKPVVPEGMAIGDRVIILHDDYGSGHVLGTLAESGLDEIAVRRQTERAGEVVVHFPREDYTVMAT
ncbi:MAG: glutathione S-transferase family protein [Myxococcota bacterium]